MILRIFPILVSAGILLLLAGCGDILGPRDRGPHGLWIGETGVVLKPGETITLTARVQETGNTGRQPGSGIEPAANARWWTDDETVLRVPSQSRGRIEALAAGRATVWVQVGARRDSASVTVLAEGEAPTHRWKAVSTSRTGTCALDAQGQAYCWGDDFWGGSGTGGDRRQFTNLYRPVRVNSSLVFEEIGRGLGFACARTSGGEVWCWGMHHGAQLGHARTGIDYETGPVRVAFPGRSTALSVGAQHACLLDTENRAHCWGSNLGFQLGVAENIFSTRERGGRTLPVAFDGTFSSLSSSEGYHTCGITPDRDLYCWGRVPIGSSFRSADIPTPTRVPTPSAPILARAGNGNSCILTEAGEAHCWGDNSGGQSGRAPDEGTDVPVPADTGLRFADLALSGGMTCGIVRGGEAWCWGAGSALDSDAVGICGDPRFPFPCTGTPIPVPGGHRFKSLSIGEAACGITIEGELYCWGQNDRGQLGIGRPGVESTHIPQRVLDPR